MSHFSDGSWVDFIHGTRPQSGAADMGSHLARGCAECREDFAVWNVVQQSLDQPEYEPPDGLISEVERLYAPAKPWRFLQDVVSWAERTFDTFGQLSPVFVRGPQGPDRHLVYEAYPFVIDVTLKTDVMQNDLLILGQVLNSQTPDRLADDVHVVVLSRTELIARTVTNENGEFAVRCEPQTDLNLFISVPGERAIGVSLQDSDSDPGSQEHA